MPGVEVDHVVDALNRQVLGKLGGAGTRLERFFNGDGIADVNGGDRIALGGGKHGKFGAAVVS